MRLAFYLALAAALWAGPAQAQLRTIPEEAKAGTLQHVQGLLVEIDGKREQLAPGVQIRDAANRLVVPTAVPADTAVKYLRDVHGQVHRVWLLSAEESEERTAGH